jgi:hypothetical protein
VGSGEFGNSRIHQLPDIVGRSSILLVAALAATSPLFAACGSGTTSAAEVREVVVWRSLGNWSGHGSLQSESFLNHSGALRLHWQARNRQAGADGSLRLTLHSAVSGRPLTVLLDVRGNSEGMKDLPEDPRTLYVVVESADADWQFAIEEAIAGPPRRPNQ